MKRLLVVCTTDSMIWNFLVPHIKELEKQGYYVECASSVTGNFYNDLVNDYGIKMNEIPFERSPYKLSNMKAYKLLCNLIKKKKFDTIFCHEPVGGAIGRLVGQRCGCKVVYMAHGFHFYKGAPKSRKIYYVVEKFLSRYTDLLITINQEDYEASLTFHAKKNVKIHGVGVDTTKFKKDTTVCNYLRNEFHLPDNAVTLLSVGELIPRKNHSTIIRAIENIGIDNLYYFVAGDGELMEDLKKEILDLKLQNQVHLLGYRTDIGKLCNSADIFVMPSVHEGLSVALMEAMCCGKPVVASKIRGNVDLIDEGKGGFLSPTFNVEAYAKQIKKLILSRDLGDKFGDYNENKVKNFDIIPVREELIQELISEE